MMESEVLKDRLTASWIIGKCRDGRFSGILLDALRGGIPELRKKAVAALARLEPTPSRGPADLSTEGNDLDLSLVSAPVVADGYELWLFVAGPEGNFLPQLRPVDFFVSAEEQFILDYSVEELSQEGDADICVVLPSGSELLRAAMTESLSEKPPAQRWALSFYGAASGETQANAVPRFESDGQSLAALLDSGPVPSAAITDAIDKVLGADAGTVERHLVLVIGEAGFNPESVRATCDEKNIRLHCWSLSEFTGKETMPVVVRNEKEAAFMWPRFVASFRNRYVLRSKRAPTSVAIRSKATTPPVFSARVDLLKGGRNA
jgi:hypothetical protein